MLQGGLAMNRFEHFQVVVNPGKLITFENITTSRGKGDSEETVFDPSKAADAVIDAFYLKTTSDDKIIWSYEGGVYKPIGEDAIDHILDHLAGNLYTIHYSKEVFKKVRARTLTKSQIFDTRKNLFGVSNGCVDLESGAFLPYSPDYNLTLRSPIKYDPLAQCPEFINFLWSAFGNMDDIITVIDMLVAMSTTATWEYFVAMIGSGSNGKTVLESVITAFFGPDQVTEVELSELNKSQFIRGAIKRKRALINSEVQGTKMESRWIKMISGGSTIDSDQKNKDRTHFRPYCLQIFDTNSPPRFYDNTFGFQRRLIKLDFRFTFVDNPDGNKKWEQLRDPQLLEKLTSEQELSGILNLVILRAKDIVKTRTIHRRVVGTELVDEYDRQSHSMSAFFNDCYSEPDTEDNWKVFSSFDSIKTFYNNYCRAINAAPENDRRIAKYIKETLGCKSDRNYVGSGDDRKRARGYFGLTFEKENYELVVNRSVLNGTDIILGQIGTDKGTDNTVSRDTRTDKTDNLNVQILAQISQYLKKTKNTVPCVPSVPVSDCSVPIGTDISPIDSNTILQQLDQIKAYMCCNCGQRMTRTELRDFQGLDYCSSCYEKESK
jgi:P4 family phage/plasmid primase-like protien